MVYDKRVIVKNENLLFWTNVYMPKTKSCCITRTCVCHKQKVLVCGKHAFVVNKNFLFMTYTHLSKTKCFWFSHTRVCHKQEHFVLDNHVGTQNKKLLFMTNTCVTKTKTSCFWTNKWVPKTRNVYHPKSYGSKTFVYQNKNICV